MEAQIEIWPTNPGARLGAGAGARMLDLHPEPLPGRDGLLQPDTNHARKARLTCTECGHKATQLYIVRPDEEICEGCLTPEDLVRYPAEARRVFGEGKEAA